MSNVLPVSAELKADALEQPFLAIAWRFVQLAALSLGAQAASAVGLALIARSLTHEDFGVLSIAQTAGQLGTHVAGWGFSALCIRNVARDNSRAPFYAV